MIIPTEPIGRIPRPLALIEALETCAIDDPKLEPIFEDAIRDTLERFAETGSPVISDGEQRQYRGFGAHTVHGLTNVAPDGCYLPFVSQARRCPRLTQGPFRYQRYADEFLEFAFQRTTVPLKQTVVAPSAISLMYPTEGLPDYSREEFLADALNEHEREIRRCLEKGAHKVQIDFTEGWLALKIDPTGELLHSFIDLNNLALSRFTAEERSRFGVHTCAAAERDADNASDELLRALFELRVGNFFIALAGACDRVRILKTIRAQMKPDHQVFIGVIDPDDPRVETPEEVRDRVLEAAEYIPLGQLGTTDDCGFSSSDNDRANSREIAFAKIQARVLGTALAAQIIGGR